MKCGFNLGEIFEINLIIFCTFVLHFHALSCNCELSVCLRIVAFKCSFSIWLWNWMGRYHNYIQEKILSFKYFSFNNYIVIIAVYRCDFLLYTLCFRLLFVKLFCILLMSLFCLCNWPFGWCIQHNTAKELK